VAYRIEPCGLCFPWAARDVIDHGGVLVHGTVEEPLAVEPNRYWHAWVERGDKVYDWQMMEAGHGGKWRGKGMPVDVFYELYQPKDIWRYTKRNAIIAMAMERHWGPWHEGSSAPEPNPKRRRKRNPRWKLDGFHAHVKEVSPGNWQYLVMDEQGEIMLLDDGYGSEEEALRAALRHLHGMTERASNPRKKKRTAKQGRAERRARLRRIMRGT
jgi:hypothetical protein